MRGENMVITQYKKYMDAINKWTNPEGDVITRVLAEKVEYNGDGIVGFFVLVYSKCEHEEYGYENIEILRLWNFGEEVSVSCEFQKEVSSKNEIELAKSMFNSLARFIK
jgi:hypothetical protein